MIYNSKTFIEGASLKDVFRYMTNVRNWEKDHPQTVEVLRDGDTPLELGELFVELTKAGPLKQRWYWEVTVNAVVADSIGVFRFIGETDNNSLCGDISYTLLAEDGGVTVKREFILNGLNPLTKLGVFLTTHITQKSSQEYLDNVKEALSL